MCHLRAFRFFFGPAAAVGRILSPFCLILGLCVRHKPEDFCRSLRCGLLFAFTILAFSLRVVPHAVNSK